jgi:crotonobetainyl-CoA:carnitine CoA-transferase CaiB-like acyl-CoA transferase
VKLCKALELEHLADDSRFASWLARLENNQALLPLIDSKFKSQPRDYWLELLAKHDIPAAPVQTVMEFMQHPAVRHHDMVHEYDHPDVGRLRLMGQPIAFRGTPTRDPGPPPTLGQHTDAVLQELGYTDEEITGLVARGVCRTGVTRPGGIDR